MNLARLIPLLALFLAIVMAGSLHAQEHYQGAGSAPPGHERHFADPQKWSSVFDDPARDAWQKPHEVIRALAPKPDDRIADIGAGTGYFTMRLARHVPQGAVFAVDIEPKMVQHLADRAKAEGLTNVRAVQGAVATPNLPEKMDLVLLVDAYHHIGDRPAYFRGLRAALKPGGRVAIIDFRPDSPVGAPSHMRLAAERVVAEMASAGFRRTQAHDFLPYQYFLVFAAQG